MLKSKQKRYQDRYRDAGLKPVQVWIYASDEAAYKRIQSEDKRAEVRKARKRDEY